MYLKKGIAIITLYYCCPTCQLIGSYEDKAGQGYELPDDIIHHPHSMVFNLKSYEQAEQWMKSCLKDREKEFENCPYRNGRLCDR